MAKRKRLILSDLTDTTTPPDPHEGRAPEVKAHLPPGLAPPIAQVAGEASATAALADLAASVAAARADGRLLQRLALSAIDTDHLVRDRLVADDEELAGLVASIRAHGQRTPVEVADLGHGRYGLISGWRRITALSRLAAEDAAFGTVLAMVRRPAHAAEAYVAMVEENEVRAGLSYYERARIAAKAADLGVFPTEKAALQALYASASRARRSKIGSFLAVYRALDPVLRFPVVIPERLGLALAHLLESRPVHAAALVADLTARPAAGFLDELQRLQEAAETAGLLDAAPKRAESRPPGAPDVSRAKHLRSGPPAPETQRETAPAPVAAPVPESHRQELRPGVFLTVTGFVTPTLTLTGPAVDQTFRERLEAWVTAGR